MAEHLIYNKLGVTIKIPNDASSADWFKTWYNNWETETFRTVQKYIEPTKYFVDIGPWNGAISMFAGKLCRGVICIEADVDSVKELKKNLEYNGISEHFIHNSAIYNENTTVKFGTNQYHQGWNKLNMSTSQIQKDNLPSVISYDIETITLKDLLEKYPKETLGLVKVDIEAGEEYILKDLVEVANIVPVLLSLHCTWWKNQENIQLLVNMVRENGLHVYDYFENKVEIDKLQGFIQRNPFGSIVLMK